MWNIFKFKRRMNWEKFRSISTKIYKWIIFSITLQVLLLIFIDSYFLGAGSTIITSSDSDLQEAKIQETSITVPEMSQNIRFSHKLDMIAYTDEKKFYVVDVKKTKLIKSIADPDEFVTFYRWMDDRNTLIYATKATEKDAQKVTIRTFDFDNAQEKTLNPIFNLSKEAYVNDIQFSHLTNIIYVKFVTLKDERIYSFDIMGNISYIATVALGTTIAETNYADCLFIDENKGKVYLRNGKTGEKNLIETGEEAKLLKVDSFDNVYLVTKDSKTNERSLKFGKTENGHVKQWSNIFLPSDIRLEDVFITQKSRVFIKRENLSKFIELSGNTEKKYEGQLIEIRDDAVIGMNGKKVSIGAL